MTYNVLTLNAIAKKGLALFPDHYHIGNNVENPAAIIVRSANMHKMDIPNSVEIIGRAGAGFNNIPIAELTARGIPVLTTPGANANAVKELVIAGILLACRNICHAWNYARNIDGDDHEICTQVEQNKKRFSGTELPGKTLGVIGLGNIGVKVANAALGLGMKVIGFDNHITVQNAWQLSSNVQQALSISELCSQADFISVHVPLTPKTKGLINSRLFYAMKNGTVLLNFARDGIVNNQDLEQALQSGIISAYVCDFPSHIFQNHPQVISLPHLGASTLEAEENCAMMVVHQVQKYLEHGSIENSVNFPDVFLPRTEGYRLCVINHNVPNIIAQISAVLSKNNLNILEMINKSKADIAYNILDVDKEFSEEIIASLRDIPGVIRVRKL